MIPPNPILKIDIAEEFARSLVTAPHQSAPISVETTESRNGQQGEWLFQRPARPGLSNATLSREDEAAAREDAALIKARAFDALQAWCDIGAALKRQKERLGHGSYLAWVKHEFGWDRHQASEFVAIHEAWSTNVGRYQHLDPSTPKQVFVEIARKNTAPEVRAKAEELLVDGQKVTVADIL